MLQYLSPHWFDAVQRAVDSSDTLTAAASGTHLVLRQIITGGPDGDVAYRLVIDDGEVRVERGDGEADLTLVEDYATAVAMLQGRLSAPAAFMTGRVRVSGNLGALLSHHEALQSLVDVFGGVRDVTDFGAASSVHPDGPA